MGFKENILKKIRINQLAQQVMDSIGSYDSGKKIDKKMVKQLLKEAAYEYKKRRDLDLYIKQEGSGQGKIIVLDNDLPIYKTTVEDVVLRKSPTVKEMLNIRNAIKILNDKDVVISKKYESVKIIQHECIDLLDLSYTPEDIKGIADEGIASLENNYSDGILETISIFSEILGYVSSPKPFRISHHKILGTESKNSTGQTLFGPLLIYSMVNSKIKLIENEMAVNDPEQIALFQAIASGQQNPTLEGAAVFHYLHDAAVKLISA